MSEFVYHNAGNSEAQQMEALSRLFAQTGTLAATGVLDGLVVTQASTANGTVLIAVGSAVVQSSMTAGASLLVCDSQKTLDIFTANPMGGLPRNDIIEFDSITATIIAHIGTPNATPTDPTVPATSVALARLRNLASATTIPTAKIDSLIVATTVRGAIGADGKANGVPIPATSTAKAGKHIHWGPYAGTTDASGYATVTHGGGFTPTVVVVTLTNIGIQTLTDTYTATTFRLRTLNSDGSVYTGAFTVSAFLGE